jgi:thiamine-monophosphate kinase
MLLEGVHFDLRTASAEHVGRKALAVNLSDIAAMAGRPTACVVSLALPRTGGLPLAEGVSAGIAALAAEFGVAVAGGDTNAWDGPLIVNVAVVGEPHPRGSVRRSGAKSGDFIYVTGRLGGSLQGRHLTFTPRVAAAAELHARFGLHAMIDLSDGLASDLRHILAESGVGAVLDRDALPVHDDAVGLGKGAPPWERALSDGEDFELCFTLPPAAAAALERQWPRGGDAVRPAVTRIGEVRADPARNLLFRDGTPVAAKGYVHTFQ